MKFGATVLFITAWGSTASGVEPTWDPAQTRVFAVGLLEWQHPKTWVGFPEGVPNRRDEQLVEFFRRAGVADGRITYLQDAEATKDEIIAAFHAALDKSRPGELFVFYFAGHGYRHVKSGKTFFVNYDCGNRDGTAWSVDSIFQAIEKQFRGDRVWLIADCCHSGALYDEVEQQRGRRLSYACLTSSYSHNSSTGTWTFTDSFLQALRGRPSVDADRDGAVSWNEAAHYVETEMAFIEGQKSMFTVAGSMNASETIAATTGLAKPKAGFHCEAQWKGKWYKAEVLEHDAARRRYRVRYVGYAARYDDWLDATRVRAYKPTEFAVGAKIQAYSDNDEAWYPAVVRESWYGLHLIHYEGFNATWDEWLGPGYVMPR